MKKKGSSGFLAVTYLEWIKWLASGKLRCMLNRITIIAPGGKEAFIRMMNTASDVEIADDAFVLAKIKDTAPIKLADAVAGGHSLEAINLSLDCIEGFMPVSQRGMNLLQATADKAGVSLMPPEFEDYWDAWFGNCSQADAQMRGNMLAQLMIKEKPDFSKTSGKALDFLQNHSKSPKIIEHQERFALTMAYAWACTFTFMKEFSMDSFLTKNKDLLQKHISDMRQISDMEQPVLSHPDATKMIASINKEISKKKDTKNIRAQSLLVIFHYTHLLGAVHKFNFEVFMEDMSKLAKIKTSKIETANTAYFVGRKMQGRDITEMAFPEIFSSAPPINKPKPKPRPKPKSSKKDQTDNSEAEPENFELKPTQQDTASIKKRKPTRTKRRLKN